MVSLVLNMNICQFVISQMKESGLSPLTSFIILIWNPEASKELNTGGKTPYPKPQFYKGEA